MKAILILPESKSAKTIELSDNDLLRQKEITKRLRVETVERIASFENDIILADSQHLTRGRNAFVLESTNTEVLVFGRALIVSANLDGDISVTLDDIQFHLYFYHHAHSERIRWRIQNNKIAMPPDEEFLRIPLKRLDKKNINSIASTEKPLSSFVQRLPGSKTLRGFY